MDPDRLVTTYLNALASADVAAVLSLFERSGQVHSPLYGTVPASEFYPGLFADTARSTLHLRKTLHGDATVAFWFDFDWVLADGTRLAPFTVVDVAELNDDGFITNLHIVYDTHPLRAVWERQHAALAP
ncbi:MAG: hypothetical protein K2Q25_06950 [Mycobacteriaceae bacterium]|nr:hypothetical protein [Mycobacteriaceae bacterium]